MAGIFGSAPSYTPPPPPPMPVIAEAPTPAPVPDAEEQKRGALREAALSRSKMTTRRSTLIGDDSDTLG